jgi:PqqD family protein of HPr-rel-A system
MSWLSLANGGLIIKHWPTECLVFNPINGSAHLLSEFAGIVLECLDCAGGPLSQEQLAWKLFEDDTPTEVEKQALHQALHAFDSLGLIERVKS